MKSILFKRYLLIPDFTGLEERKHYEKYNRKAISNPGRPYEHLPVHD